jgi:hypothetical protein
MISGFRNIGTRIIKGTPSLFIMLRRVFNVMGLGKNKSDFPVGREV